MGTQHFDIFWDAFYRSGGRNQHWMSREVPVRFDWFKSAVSGHDSAATSLHRDFEVAPRPRCPVTALLIDPDVSKPITTGPGNSGTFPQAISAALCSAVRIFCGTSKSAFKFAAKVMVRELSSRANLRLVSDPVSNVIDPIVERLFQSFI